MDSASAAASRELRDLATTTTTTRAAGRRSVDAELSRTYNVDELNVGGRSSTPSSLSTPRTYVVEVLAATDDESSRHTSPRITDRLARRCRRRRPQSLDIGQCGRPSVSTPTKDGEPEVGLSSHQSSSTETFVYTKAVSQLSQSLRRRRRRSDRASPHGTAVVASSTPNLPEVRRPPRRRRSSASSEGEIVVPSLPRRAEPVEVQVPSREDVVDAPTKKSNISDHHPTSRLPRLVSRPHDTLPSTSSVSASVVRAPRPRSFRYSRLHRRAIDALVPPPVRDVPWRWAWKASTDIN